MLPVCGPSQQKEEEGRAIEGDCWQAGWEDATGHVDHGTRSQGASGRTGATSTGGEQQSATRRGPVQGSGQLAVII